MSVGFKLFKDGTGEILVDSQYITYGLIASGYLTRNTTWRRWILASAHLDPNDPDNYRETNPVDPIFAFTVYGCIAPIAFIHGQGVFCGSSRDGNATTFYYLLAYPTTRIYVFDTMRNPRPGTGLKTFSDDALNTLTFNSDQPPMNILGSVQPPPPYHPDFYPDGVYSIPYTGGSMGWGRTTAYGDGGWYWVTRYPVATGAGNFAANLSFRRSMAGGRQDNTLPPNNDGASAYVSYMGYSEGCYGTAGGIEFIACDAPRTQMIAPSSALTQAFTVPTDRYPTALIINIDNLPFPYTAF